MPDLINDKMDGAQFEASVRHVARQLYRHAYSTGSIKLDDRERDEVIDTGTELIIVEATQSRKLEKIKGDLKKSIDLVKKLRYSADFSEYNFRIMLVTAEDPTADQNAYFKMAKSGCPKELISFTALFSRLFDARHYIRIRGDHAFGSVRDPADEANYKVPQDEYIPTALSREGTSATIKAADLASSLENGGRYVVYGDFGSGKSMTLRDVYFRVRDKFSRGESLLAPIYLNLRDHVAQTQPKEVLHRHAEEIGLHNYHSLISAWRAGFVALFLDGFDELIPPQFASSVNNLRQARRFAVEIVSNFMKQTPQSAPILIAGRESYFDSREEAQAALGYNENANVFDLAGFTDQDIKKYLKASQNQIPAWLPTRPLLLGYLANSGFLKSGDPLMSLNPADGWDQMLQRVCEREVSQIWGVGFEPSDLRLFIEGLATRARKSPDGRGLEDSGLRRVFRSVFGRDTKEPDRLLTGRLPGLGAVPGRSGAREFIDADFADAASSGDVCRYIEGAFVSTTPLANVTVALCELGREMTAARINDLGAKARVALMQASQDSNLATTCADLIAILVDQRLECTGSTVEIQDVSFDRIVVDCELNFSSICFSRCIISAIEINRSIYNKDRSSPQFRDCIIGRLEGAVSERDLPTDMLVGSCSVDVFSAFTETNDAVMSSPLPEPVKVLLTILRKLFMQRGTGRQYSALRRGLPHAMRKYVEPISDLVKSQGYGSDIYIDRRTILVPNRTRSADAFAIINGPNSSMDQLIQRVRAL